MSPSRWTTAFPIVGGDDVGRNASRSAVKKNPPDSGPRGNDPGSKQPKHDVEEVCLRNKNGRVRRVYKKQSFLQPGRVGQRGARLTCSSSGLRKICVHCRHLYDGPEICGELDRSAARLWWFCMCDVSAAAVLYPLLHTVHWNGFWLSCVFMWIFRWSLKRREKSKRIVSRISNSFRNGRAKIALLFAFGSHTRRGVLPSPTGSGTRNEYRKHIFQHAHTRARGGGNTGSGVIPGTGLPRG